MEKDNFLEESIKKCVEHAMLQDDDGKRRILTGLFEWNNKLINEQLVIQALNDDDKKQWFVDDMIIASQKETEELQDRIDKAIEYIENQQLHKFQDTTGGITYNERKLLEILKGE